MITVAKLYALCAVAALSGCAALPFSGFAVEVTGAATSLSPSSGASDVAAEGLGTTVGVSLSLEVDYVRSSGMGAGLAYLSTTLPREGMAPTRGSTAAAQYDFSSAFTKLGSDALRPRIYLGALLGDSDSTWMMSAYVGGGISLHPARGHALHAFVGPHVLGLDQRDQSLEYSGTGGFVRLRYYRNFFRRCDVPPSEAARQAAEGHEGPAKCSR